MKFTTSERKRTSESPLDSLYTRQMLTILEWSGYLRLFERLLFAFIRLAHPRCLEAERRLLLKVLLHPDHHMLRQSLLRTTPFKFIDGVMVYEPPPEFS